MATILKTRTLPISPESAWRQLEATGEISRYFDLIESSSVEGSARRCTTKDGQAVEEQILSVDPRSRRVAYTITHSPFGFTHHNSAMSIDEDGGEAKLTWVTDILPDALGDGIAEILEREFEHLCRNLKERAS